MMRKKRGLGWQREDLAKGLDWLEEVRERKLLLGGCMAAIRIANYKLLEWY